MGGWPRFLIGFVGVIAVSSVAMSVIVRSPDDATQPPIAPTPIVSGPATAGSRITVAGRQIQLDSETYVETYVTCRPAGNRPCSLPPIYVLRHGNSHIDVASDTGALDQEDLAPGEEHAFDRLREALRHGA